MEKTTKEALAILGRYIGRTTEAKYILNEPIELEDITGAFIQAVANKFIKSFRITSLRSLDEMTEEEKEKYNLMRSFDVVVGYAGITGAPIYGYRDTAESIHYLESIGIDTMNLKDVTILIKD